MPLQRCAEGLKTWFLWVLLRLFQYLPNSSNQLFESRFGLRWALWYNRFALIHQTLWRFCIQICEEIKSNAIETLGGASVVGRGIIWRRIGLPNHRSVCGATSTHANFHTNTTSYVYTCSSTNIYTHSAIANHSTTHSYTLAHRAPGAQSNTNQAAGARCDPCPATHHAAVSLHVHEQRV